jgi:transposase
MAKQYSDEFKAETVRHYHRAGKSFKALGRDLGVSGYSIRKWVLEASEHDASPGARQESEELKRLRRENRILREEREILRKAAAFFATDDRSTR